MEMMKNKIKKCLYCKTSVGTTIINDEFCSVRCMNSLINSPNWEVERRDNIIVYTYIEDKDV